MATRFRRPSEGVPAGGRRPGLRWLVPGALVGALAGPTFARPALARPQHQPDRPTARSEPVAVIDLRPAAADRGASRAVLIEALAGVNGIAPLGDRGLVAALAGESLVQLAADQALDRAQTAYGAIDCATTAMAATAAIDGYAALQAAGVPVTEVLQRGYVYLLLCASSQGDSDAAQRAATQLRRLGGDGTPTGVTPTIWSRYPAIDAASNVAMVELTITTSPAGAEVWLDHARLGLAPQTAIVLAGEHIVAAATAEGAISRRVDVAAGEPIALEITDTSARWDKVRRQVAGWRSGDTVPDAIALAVLLGEIRARFAVVVAGNGQAEVWGCPGDGAPARRITTNTITASFELGAAIVAQVEAWEGPQDIVEIGAPELQYASPRRPQKWWVYAGILGAIAVGTGLILANDLAPDHQRIELTWP